MKKNNKQRLFEVMAIIDSSFKRKLTEEVQLQRYDDSEPAQHLSDFEERVYSYVEKMYPDIQYIMIDEKFIPHKGWISCKCTLDEKNINKLIQEGVEVINLKIINRFGDVRYPDYRIEEFERLRN